MSKLPRGLRALFGVAVLLPLSAHAAEFSIVVIPDTQMYVEQHPEIFEAQIDWIVANEVAENIVYVAHLGDIKDDSSCDNKTVNVGTGGGRSEWQIADQALAELGAAGIAYGVVPGNHDFDQVSGDCPNFTTERPLGTYNSLFGPTRFSGTPYYGDPSVPTAGNRVINSNEDNFTLFESNGVKFIAINLAYKEGANPIGMDPEVVWANNLLSTYSDRLGIITSHYFMDENPGNDLGPYGQEIYDGLSGNPNLFMMLSAHERGEAWLTETTGRGGMEPVQILLQDYQSMVFPSSDGDPMTPPNDPNPAGIDFDDLNETSFGDSGLMRIFRFDTITGMVNVETFIPPVIPIKNRPGTLVSTYFPADGNGMDDGTASNLSFSYQGYVPTVVACEGLTEPLTIVEDSANRFEVTFKNDDFLSISPVGATGSGELSLTSGGESASIAITIVFRDGGGPADDIIFIFQSIAGDEFFPDPSNEAGDVLVYSNANGFSGADAVNGDGLLPGFANTELTVTVGVSRDQPFCGRLVLSN